MAQAKKRTISSRGLLLLCIPLLLAGIAAEGVFLLRRPEQPVAGLSQQSSVRDPEHELTDALRGGDYDAAELLLETDFFDVPVPEQAVQMLTEQAAAVHAAYLDGTADADTAEAALRRFLAMDIPALTDAAAPLLEEVRLHEAALSCQKLAAAYAAAGDHQKAMEQYDLIPKTERELYADAQTQIAACAAEYQAETAAEAEAFLAAADYAAAESLLKKALQIVPEAADLQALLERSEQRQQAEVLHTVMQSARSSFDAGAYTDAFAALRTLPESTEAVHIAESYRTMYLLHLQTDTMKLLRRGEWEAAAAQIAEAEQLFPDASEPAALRTELAAYLPVTLSALEAGEQSDFMQAEAALTDCCGTEYTAEDGNLYDSYDGDLTGRKRSSAEFQTNGLYSVLTLTAAPMATFSADAVLLEISGDGKKIELYTVTRETGALHIELDITGVQTLRIQVMPFGRDDLRNAGVIFAEGTVRK